jgi:hypothetical protein
VTTGVQHLLREDMSLLGDGVLANLVRKLSVWSLWLANAFARLSSYSEELPSAIDITKHLQQKVILTTSALNIAGSCGLDTYIDASITCIFAFTPKFIMQVSVRFIMAGKSMRPGTGNGTLFEVTAASHSLENNHIIHEIHIDQSE